MEIEQRRTIHIHIGIGIDYIQVAVGILRAIGDVVDFVLPRRREPLSRRVQRRKGIGTAVAVQPLLDEADDELRMGGDIEIQSDSKNQKDAEDNANHFQHRMFLSSCHATRSLI